MDGYMGIDIGTSGCKAVVFAADGRQLAGAYREYDVLTPRPGWAELNSTEVLDKCCQVIAEAAARAAPASVRGLGISSQGEAFTPLDADGQAVGNALVSSDTRAAECVERFPEQFGPERLYRITGHTAHPMFSLFKLLWLRDHRPRVWSAARRFLCFEDLLQLRLGLEPSMGWPLAGRTMLFDVRQHRWSEEILDAAGLRADQLARPLPSGTVAGTVPPAIARELGLAEGAFVVAGGHDQTCGALGAGVTSPGRAMYATGTVECITPAFAEPTFADALRDNNLCTYDHTVAGMYATVAFSLTGGNILKWFRDEFGAAEVEQARARGVSAYELLLSQAGDEPSPLLVLPYFTPTGTPHFDTRATGAILGLRLTSTRRQLLRALLEGVAFEMRLNLQILESCGCRIDELRAIGGGARSALWTQLKADTIGKPIVVLNTPEAGCMGMALLARAAHAGESVADLAERWNRPVGQMSPRPGHADWYARRFELYRRLYPTLRDIRL